MTSAEQLADVLARLPVMKYSEHKGVKHAVTRAYLLECIFVIESIPAMLEQAERKTLEEAANLCDGHGQMHGGTAQRIKREILKLAEGKE